MFRKTLSTNNCKIFLYFRIFFPLCQTFSSLFRVPNMKILFWVLLISFGHNSVYNAKASASSSCFAFQRTRRFFPRTYEPFTNIYIKRFVWIMSFEDLAYKIKKILFGFVSAKTLPRQKCFMGETSSKHKQKF